MKKIILIITVVFLAACESDVQVMSDWKSLPVVYGILDPTDSVQYIRVTKGYNGEGDAAKMAMIPDSLYYDSLVLYLEEYDGANQLLRTIALQKTYLQKEEGAFAGGLIPVYYTTEVLDSWTVYRLNGYIPKYDSWFSSSARMINGFSPGLSFGIRTSFNLYVGNSEKIDWTNAAHAKRYEVWVRFHYYELDENYDSTEKSVEYLSNTIVAPNTEGGSIETASIKGSSFMANMNVLVGTANGLKRKAGELEIIVRCADENMNTYISLTEQAENSSLAPPFFTNIDDGAGILAAQSTYYGSNRKLSNRAVDSLSKSPLTKHLNFADSDGRYHGN